MCYLILFVRSMLLFHCCSYTVVLESSYRAVNLSLSSFLSYSDLPSFRSRTLPTLLYPVKRLFLKFFLFIIFLSLPRSLIPSLSPLILTLSLPSPSPTFPLPLLHLLPSLSPSFPPSQLKIERNLEDIEARWLTAVFAFREWKGRNVQILQGSYGDYAIYYGLQF